MENIRVTISQKTIPQIKDELTKSNIDFSDIVKKKGKNQILLKGM